jgi:hypothetical protein
MEHSSVVQLLRDKLNFWEKMQGARMEKPIWERFFSGKNNMQELLECSLCWGFQGKMLPFQEPAIFPSHRGDPAFGKHNQEIKSITKASSKGLIMKLNFKTSQEGFPLGNHF